MESAAPFDAFSALGLPRRLDLPDAEIESAWRRLSRELHPDTDGGDAAGAAAANRARDILASPARRLRHWLELRGFSLPRHGAVDDDLMTLFTETSATLADADLYLTRNLASASALARALLAESGIAAQMRTQALLARLQSARVAVTDRFAELAGDDGRALAAAARLSFLEKWEGQCRERLLSLLAAG